MRYFIDSDIFLRVLAKDNKKQYSFCVNFLNLLKKNKINGYTSTLILAEIVWTLSFYYRFKKEEVVRAFKSIIALRGLKIFDQYDCLKAIELYEKHSVKFIDALIASNKEILEKKVIVISYDKDFDKLPVIRRKPEELISK